MEALHAERLVVSGQGLREGLVWQELRGEGAVLPDVRAASIAGLALANGVDALGAEPVVSAAGALFQATEARHGLGQPELELLLAGARLAGIGMHIDYYNRDRHAEYLVHSGDLHGFSHREIVLLGSLVRHADSGTPDFAAYGALVEADDSRRAGVLAALLGAARAVRRRTPSPVLGFFPSLAGEELRLDLRAIGSLEAETIALERQQRRLESALRVSVRVSVSS
jgi:exopolyphosphatase/guanosine-5'-triphosphate,3'-diphosphate pyrophosphatase